MSRRPSARPPPADAPPAPDTAPPPSARGPLAAAARSWLSAYRTEVLLFAVAFAVLASFSSQRFLRQSAAPHFIYQAKSWLDGRLDVDPEVVPNLEDWACVREVAGRKVRCEGPLRPGDTWHVSFPSFPAVVMLPFVALHGYQFNDTSFTVLVGALALALFHALLRRLAREGELLRDASERVLLTLTLGFGSLFFYCAIRGEVWFSAEVLGVALTCVYLRLAVRAAHPGWAGLAWAAATLTRTPLLFSGLFFLLEALVPGPDRRASLRALREDWRPAARALGRFALGALPLALPAALYNLHRFGSPGEFGHAFLYNNRVNADIDRFGLFDLAYLQRNLEAAWLMLPRVSLSPFRLQYDPRGLSLLVTMPWLVFLAWPRARARLQLPAWLTVAACALPGLFYQNTGYMQFGFRFSLDYTPYLVLLLGLTGWRLKAGPLPFALALALLVNFWGAVAFSGYTEYVRGW